ncbi:hypothetical protein NDU88_002926 [Pleurodeles waltl]|uniref:Uncharacterized protein n=1 Tax=Pleurodeles waltl TaxID=8319 RepID=A0AAV7LDR6_PLEWA|nr:hypothetical protein NDU88_002926 [Pleurodeles waltl]
MLRLRRSPPPRFTVLTREALHTPILSNNCTVKAGCEKAAQGSCSCSEVTRIGDAESENEEDVEWFAGEEFDEEIKVCVITEGLISKEE